MSLILNIDTAVDIASVCLAKDGKAIQGSSNKNQKDHSSWLHPAIAELLTDTGFIMKDIDAVAVTIGPGSYTGLRVGLSTAKGLCYAMGIPLIAINTLEMMAFAVKNEAVDFICPIIDARRMEVFTAVYDINLNQIIDPLALILSEGSFSEILNSHKILFCGNANKKLKEVILNSNALFSNTIGNASAMASLSYQRFCKKEFADTAYTVPFYIKEFYSTVRKG